MATRVARRLANTNKVALGLAVGTTAALGTAVATGHSLSTPEVVGAFGIAGVIGVLNSRGGRIEAQPHTLAPLPEDSSEAVVLAPRARTVVAHPARHTDAA